MLVENVEVFDLLDQPLCARNFLIVLRLLLSLSARIRLASLIEDGRLRLA